MSKCAVKRGFVTLRDCGAEASDTCGVCSRPVCQEHTKVAAGGLFCVECYARKQNDDLAAGEKSLPGGEGAKTKASAKALRGEQDWEDNSWPYYYRHNYYSTYQYNPFYYGSSYDSYYDDYDVRSFDGAEGQTLDNEDSSGEGFYDS